MQVGFEKHTTHASTVSFERSIQNFYDKLLCGLSSQSELRSDPQPIAQRPRPCNFQSKKKTSTATSSNKQNLGVKAHCAWSNHKPRSTSRGACCIPRNQVSTQQPERQTMQHRLDSHCRAMGPSCSWRPPQEVGPR